MGKIAKSKSHQTQTHRTYVETLSGKTMEKEENSTIIVVITGGLL